MASPYRKQPRKSFWQTMAINPCMVPANIFTPRFAIGSDDRIVAAGSCFAQHISANLRQRGFRVLDAEPAPAGLSVDVAQRFGYGLYSARYGNIYTARQLKQLILETRGKFIPADAIWERKGRFYDALRPSVEPEGLGNAAEVVSHRVDHLSRLRQLFKNATLFVFTLGLTETFVHRESGTVYPTAPETIAGHYDPNVHAYQNFTYDEVLQDLVAVRKLLRSVNPGLRFLLTVSPVPLAATASNQHALVATILSKSILRAAAGAMYERFDDVDYFPSYEMIATPFLRPLAYADDLRNVRSEAVERVMDTFFSAYGWTDQSATDAAPAAPIKVEEGAAPIGGDVICEEKLLEAFVA